MFLFTKAHVVNKQGNRCAVFVLVLDDTVYMYIKCVSVCLCEHGVCDREKERQCFHRLRPTSDSCPLCCRRASRSFSLIYIKPLNTNLSQRITVALYCPVLCF